MKSSLIFPCALLLVAGCTPPYRMVYSSGFSFARYNFLVVSKPDEKSSTTLYGLDIEFANMMTRYNMKVIGDKEYQSLTSEQKQQTLIARMSVIASSKKENLISISFDDSVSGKTVASITAKAKGDMFDASDRTKAFESVSDALLQAMQRDKGLTVSDTGPSKSK